MFPRRANISLESPFKAMKNRSHRENFVFLLFPDLPPPPASARDRKRARVFFHHAQNRETEQLVSNPVGGKMMYGKDHYLLLDFMAEFD